MLLRQTKPRSRCSCRHRHRRAEKPGPAGALLPRQQRWLPAEALLPAPSHAASAEEPRGDPAPILCLCASAQMQLPRRRPRGCGARATTRAHAAASLGAFSTLPRPRPPPPRPSSQPPRVRAQHRSSSPSCSTRPTGLQTLLTKRLHWVGRQGRLRFHRREEQSRRPRQPRHRYLHPHPRLPSQTRSAGP